MNEDTKRKISETIKKQHKEIFNYGMKGKHHSNETKIRMSLAQKGAKSWIFGKHLSEEHKNNISKNNAKFQLGKHLSEATKNKISSTLTGRKLSNKTKEKMSKSMKGRKFSKETLKKISLARLNQTLPVKDTKIEVKIQSFLKQLNIEFFTHQHINIEHRFQCDILIPSLNIIIECDGDYWHKYPIGKDIDKIRTKELIEKGFKVLRLWENEIKIMELNDFKERLYEKSNKNTY